MFGSFWFSTDVSCNFCLQASESDATSSAGTRAYVCQVCKKDYKHKTYLNTHLRKHNKTYCCNTSGKVFSRKDRLNVTEHEGIMLPCPDCEKRFKTLDGLRRHRQQHSGEFTHLCPICAQGFILRLCVLLTVWSKPMLWTAPDQSWPLLWGMTQTC